MKRYPICLVLGMTEHHITVDSARGIIEALEDQIRQISTKCPTCRCLLAPGEACRCCTCVDEADPNI